MFVLAICGESPTPNSSSTESAVTALPHHVSNDSLPGHSKIRAASPAVSGPPRRASKSTIDRAPPRRSPSRTPAPRSVLARCSLSQATASRHFSTAAASSNNGGSGNANTAPSAGGSSRGGTAAAFTNFARCSPQARRTAMARPRTRALNVVSSCGVM
jgi:hypothetical protein